MDNLYSPPSGTERKKEMVVIWCLAQDQDQDKNLERVVLGGLQTKIAGIYIIQMQRHMHTIYVYTDPV